jgi:RNA polymerase sigma-70 factor (ECF subfamily)
VEDSRRYFGEARIIREDVIKQVREEIEKLPPKQKAVFILKTYDGLNYQEIARITNSRIGTVKATYFQTIQKLKKNLYIKEVIKNEL